MTSKQKQLASIVFTFIIYTIFFSWKIGLLLVVAVGFHEQSHLLAAKYMGLKTNRFYLFPFIGGVAFIASRYRTYAQQAFVVLAGPIGGGILAGITAGAYYLTGYSFLAAAAYWMAFLNIFNLFPLSFMDGGQVMGTITYSINETLGMVCLTISTLIAIVALWFFNPFLTVIIGYYGGMAVWREIKNWQAKREGKYWLCSDEYLYRPIKLSALEMGLTICTWIGSVALLGVLMIYLRNTTEVNLTTAFK